jgi:predicted nuclease with RNAse H fold
MTVVGLDLAGAQTRPTGFCRLTEKRAETALIYFDEEILLKVQESQPKVVAIDAPLSLPPGRKSIEERTSEHLREADRELLRRGIKFFPITLGPMRKLTERGMHLKATLEVRGYCVVEAYPGGAQDILGIPRKQRGLDKLKAGLEAQGITGLCGGLSDHELDAVTCALVAKMYVEGKAVTYGEPKRGIVMPPGDKLRPKSDVCAAKRTLAE